ncbi:hypothetical protein MPH_03988 [Macrophomina phaseolina MS6]|uniref:Peptidase M43 pregnancy-associated plasma-A domain-containing protein n=1 Tax=Macrophomina phaseolina (strain MS6) TaxID=1126212 RepID=K2S1B7_MACPH|nr:hypothetical protein MPH_03988 [Macrophomina phaseolina MS6]
MRLSIPFVTILMSTAISSKEYQKCGTVEPSTAVFEIAREQQLRGKSKLNARQQREGLTIPTYFHVVESQERNGSITEQMLTDQLSVLQQTFAPHNISFTLLGTTFTVNDSWAAVIQHADMSASLRRGGYDTLNMYFQTGMAGVPDGITGWCNFPVSDPINETLNGTSYFVFDGCHVNPDTMPGGAGGGYQGRDNAGKTATHETGHWLGLFHTFDGFDCGGEGDMIADTPAQSEATRGCPLSPPKDSCPELEGVDPIHNYMDYSSDECKTEFTPQQVDRMYETFYSLRLGK